MKLYFLDTNRYYTGNFIEVPDGDPIPPRVADIDPPEDVPQDHYLKWSGESWEITDVSSEDLNQSPSSGTFEPTEPLPSYPIVNSWDEFRLIRSQLLAGSDWTQSRDVVLANDEEWKIYRQALRDIPSRFLSVETIEWPSIPE